jgi:hypothetical protein
MTMSADFTVPARHAQLIWLDPGSTTGMVALSVRPSWLEGQGDPSWEGLRKALTRVWHGQTGRDPRTVEARTGRARRTETVVRGAQGHSRVKVKRRQGDDVPRAIAEELSTLSQCEALLDLWPEAVWGYEEFTPRLNVPTGPDYLAPVRISAALRYVEMVYGESRRTPFVQTASMAMTTATDARLDLAGPKLFKSQEQATA